MQMSSCGYIMTWMLWCKHTLFKTFPLFSKRGFHNAWNQNILKTWFIIHEKSSSFWLKAPKKLVITIRKSSNGASTSNLMIWLKRFTIWLSKRGGTFPRLFFGKMNSLKIKHFKKISFFLVPEYDNLTSVKIPW